MVRTVVESVELVVSVVLYQWYCISGIVSVVSYRWYRIGGIVSVVSYRWYRIGGIVSVVSYRRWYRIGGIGGIGGGMVWVTITVVSVVWYQWSVSLPRSLELVCCTVVSVVPMVRKFAPKVVWYDGMVLLRSSESLRS